MDFDAIAAAQDEARKPINQVHLAGGCISYPVHNPTLYIGDPFTNAPLLTPVTNVKLGLYRAFNYYYDCWFKAGGTDIRTQVNAGVLLLLKEYNPFDLAKAAVEILPAINISNSLFMLTETSPPLVDVVPGDAALNYKGVEIRRFGGDHLLVRSGFGSGRYPVAVWRCNNQVVGIMPMFMLGDNDSNIPKVEDLEFIARAFTRCECLGTSKELTEDLGIESVDKAVAAPYDRTTPVMVDDYRLVAEALIQVFHAHTGILNVCDPFTPQQRLAMVDEMAKVVEQIIE